MFLYHPWKQTAIFVGLMKGATWRLRGRSRGWPIVHAGATGRCRAGRIRLGHFTRLATGVRVEAVGEGTAAPASVSIGDYTRVGEGTRIYAQRSVTIGAGCAISWNCTIADVGMPVAESDDAPGVLAAPIVIEDHVWIGCNVQILNGITIGSGAVIAAGSVVTSDVPAGMLAMGNPARAVRKVAQWR